MVYFFIVIFTFLSYPTTVTLHIVFNDQDYSNLPRNTAEGFSKVDVDSIELAVSVDVNNTVVKIDGKTIYSHKRNGSSDFEHTSGIHCIILHQETFQVISKSIFFTAQPASDKQVIRKLANVHDGRVVILIGTANFPFWFREEAQDYFYESGTILGPRVALGEPWTLVFRKTFSSWKEYELDARFWDDSPYKSDDILNEIRNLNRNRTRMKKMVPKQPKFRVRPLMGSNTSISNLFPKFNSTGSSFKNSSRRSVFRNEDLQYRKTLGRILGKFAILFEGLTTVKNYERSISSPIEFFVDIKAETEPECSWHLNASLNDLTKFCSLYDGYKPFCRCHDRAPLLPKFGPPTSSEEYYPIPVAIVTATRIPQVLRQVRQIREAPGGGTVPICICVDGFNAEARHLGRLIGVSVIFHRNKYKKGGRDRVNSHVGWSLSKIVELNSNSNYFIILEDDLDLSPDFIRYFQQVAWLMDVDPSIKVANAYNYNAYPHTALDASRIHIVQSYPYYGWMVRRDDALTIIKIWPTHETIADWDLYLHYYFLNNSFAVIPEVPRTKHIGGGGVHVSGYVQETTYNVRPLNKDPEVELDLKRHWPKAYILDTMMFSKTALALNISKEGPCSNPPLSTEKPGGKYVLYLNLSGDGDEAASYAAVSQCLGFYEENMLEQLDGTMRRRFFYNDILLIACPVSPYCDIDEESSLIYTPTEEAKMDADELSFITMETHSVFLKRREPATVFEEFQLKNVYKRVIDLNE